MKKLQITCGIISIIVLPIHIVMGNVSGVIASVTASVSSLYFRKKNDGCERQLPETLEETFNRMWEQENK